MARIDGMEEFHFHQLRHTFTSNLLSNGAPPKDVQELLGHSQLATMMNNLRTYHKGSETNFGKTIGQGGIRISIVPS